MDNQRPRIAKARIGCLAAALVAIGWLAAAPAATAQPAAAEAQPVRDAGAEQFVQSQGQRLVSILADKSDSADDRLHAFRAALHDIADVPRITRFVLGKYARTITPDQMQRFAAVFEDYEQNVYFQRLSDWHGDTLTVTGSLVLKPGDVIVKSNISGGDLKKPTPVAWRVRGSGSDWKVEDVQAEDIWLTILQQKDFVSTIDFHSGDIERLISQLQAQTQAAAPGADH
jgi:phospholipid transport system substrate-binding protein